MKKRMFAVLLAVCLLLSVMAGCGATGSSAEIASAASAENVPENPPAAEPVPDTAEPAAEASASAQEDAAPVVEHQYNFPGSDTAQLDYINEYTLPISEEGTTLTWMRNQLNLMGPLGELGLSTLQDLPGHPASPGDHRHHH